jgi:hypothetical protein
MIGKGYFFLLTAALFFVSCSKKLVPETPLLAHTDFKLDSLPNSEFNIPIQVNLKPVYAVAEKNIDTVFTSPNWPIDWITEDCGTRYKYHFRRGPLQFRASGLSLNLGFTGYYQIIGSTRACVNGVVLSPWTPACRCGFDEGERKVSVAFNNSISLSPDYKIRLSIRRMEPVAQDKCSVCFWGQDITPVVLNGLKEELDLSKKAIEDSFSIVDLKQKFKEVWQKINEPFNLYGLGWLQINPQQFRINNLFAKNDSLNVFLGLSARPVIRLEKPKPTNTVLPNLGPFNTNSGFNIFLDAVLNYDSLSRLASLRLKDQRFDFSKGPVKKIFIIRDIHLYGEHNEKLVIKINFGGTDEGVVYLTGKPVYDTATKKMEIKNLDFDLRTKDLLVKSAGWLFNRRILNEVQKHTVFDLGAYIDSAKTTLNKQLNTELIKGIFSYGAVDDIKLLGLYPLKEHLVIRSNLSGNLTIKVSSIDFSL